MKQLGKRGAAQDSNAEILTVPKALPFGFDGGWRHRAGH